jgi:hypothetical protein
MGFVTGIDQGPRVVRLVHGDPGAKRALAKALADVASGAEVVIP